MDPTSAQLTAFLWFIRNIMGINTTVLPDNSPVITYALTTALQYVSLEISCISCELYNQALNNLAGHYLVVFAQDQSGQTYFKDLRKTLHVNDFVAGVVQSASDESTSDALVVPEFFKGITLQNLQLLKTQWGQQYMAITQELGPVWGVS